MSIFMDLTGQRYGRIVVLSRTVRDCTSRTEWLCRCDCGTEKIIAAWDTQSIDEAAAVGREIALINTSPIAVSVSELQEFGCPWCGYRSGFTPMSVGTTTLWECADRECRRTCMVLANGVKVAAIRVGDGAYPELQGHPRRGIPSHGTPDKRPDDGSEFFGSRGVGADWTPGCFVCGGKYDLRHNIAAFVQCMEAGDRVVAMFATGARLDYRPSEPDRVQVKIGACDKHRRNLDVLHELTRDGVIASERIEDARQVAKEPQS